MIFRGSFSVCRSIPFLLNFEIFKCFGGLSNTHHKAVRFASLNWRAGRLGVQSCGRFRRGNVCDDKQGWGFLFRVSSSDQRKVRSRGWHSHRGQGFCRSMLLACDFEHKNLKKFFENHYACLNLKSLNIHSKRFVREGGHSVRKLEGCHTNQVVHFGNRVCAQIDGGSDKILRKDESLIRLNSQESDFRSARTSVSSAPKQSKSRKKAALAIFKSLDMQRSSAEVGVEEAQCSTQNPKAKRQILSENLNDNPLSPFVRVLSDEGTAKLATSFEEYNLMEMIEQQKPSAAREESLKMPPKRKKYTPETQLRWELDMCSKSANFLRAIEIYEKTIKEGELSFNQYHYNIVLYLCSAVALGVLEPRKSGNCSSQQATKLCVFESEPDNTQNGELGIDQNGSMSLDEGLGGSMAGFVGKNVMGISKEMMDFAQKKGFQIYQDMCSMGVPRNEATFTAVARLAVAHADGDLAFQMVKEMIAENMSPRLRSYGPALYIYYKKKNVEKAFEVDNHMLQYGIMPEETELQVLLGLSSEAGLAEKVYSLLHRLRTTVRDLAPSTVDVIEQWFNSKAAKKAKTPSQSVPTLEAVMSAMVSKGGGWHGLGWLGSGRWKVEKTNINKNGFCQCCGERLVTIDIDPHETEKFQQSLATLAYERANFGNTFKNFQDWLDQHGPFDAVVDGANIAMYNQNFQGSGFNFSQLNTVVSEIQRLHPSGRLPLTILHNKRANGVRATNPLAQRVLNEWSNSHAFYSTPTGSNDDWYWLYAAVKNKCLIVTNDEMRDHLFQLLGKDFFPKWKERHQVRFTLPGRSANFHMPPPYSIVIQESVTGSWHIPKAGGDDVVSPREWLCITRPHGIFTKDSLSEQEKASALESLGREPGSPLRSTSGEDNGSLTPGKVTKRSSPSKSRTALSQTTTESE